MDKDFYVKFSPNKTIRLLINNSKPLGILCQWPIIMQCDTDHWILFAGIAI